MGRQRGNGLIGLFERQSPGRLACHARFVDRIQQREPVRLARKDPAKQSIERRRYAGLDHGLTSVVKRAVATRFREDIPQATRLPDVLSDSSARSIALVR